ncbi:MAG: BREX-3 system phosphatase PglZ [Anaerolineae bacterium]|jgi:hypothetical protein
MSSWRDLLLKEFTPKAARLTLVADPDGLLLEEGILDGIRDRGFELIPFEDPVAFRYAYESRFRSHWDRGENTDLVVVLRSPATDLSTLPYDLLQTGRMLSFSLGEIFPHLSYPVVAALDPSNLDALYDAQQLHAPGVLGDNATKEFALRHVFGIAPELIKQPSDLLRVLLRRHYLGQRIPAILDERLIQLLRQGDAFADWPLELIARDREAFWAFLQERWAIFLDRVAEDNLGIHEQPTPYALSIEGPVDLPFDHDDVRVYISNLFLEGWLRPVAHRRADALAGRWASVGVQSPVAENRRYRQARLKENLGASLPGEAAGYAEWLRFARGWAELTLMSNDLDASRPSYVSGDMASLRDRVDVAFSAWLCRRYANLINLPAAPPVMLHHVPRFMARRLQEHETKVALLVIDGLALDQWLVVREALALRRPSYRFREQAVFAWIPSITSISRQALFAGRPPVYFPDSVRTADREPALWLQFWEDQGLAQNEVAYIKGLGDDDLERVDELISSPRIRAVGLIIDKVDRIMHGMELGAAGMINQVRQWAYQPDLDALLELLLDREFAVFLTSDHGNVEATGCGRPSEGSAADLRGERVRIYSDRLVRRRMRERFPCAVEWETVGLPEDYLPLLAPARDAFVREGDRLVTHGGMSVEEIIVPLVEIEMGGT